MTSAAGETSALARRLDRAVDGHPSNADSARFRVNHRTVYHYAQPAQRVLALLRLKPRPAPGQTLERFQLRVKPAGGRIDEHVDVFGNPCALTEWSRPQNRLVLEVTFDLRRDMPEASLIASTALDQVSMSVPVATDACLDAALYRIETGRPDEGRDILSALDLATLPDEMADWTVLSLADALATRIPEHFAYVPGATTVETSIDELLRDRRGVCQDFAHLAVAAARSLGVPARYVSGYLETAPPPGQPRLRGADATHAWASLYDPALGWIDIDPTNACRCDLRHLTLAWGRGYSDVAPVSGVFQGGVAAGLEVSVDVERLIGVPDAGVSGPEGVGSGQSGSGGPEPGPA